MNVKAVIETLCSDIKKHVDTAVVGLSGGADSFLVMLLSEEALGKENVHALSLPYSDTDIKTFNSLSTMYAEHIGVHHQVVAEQNRDSLHGRAAVKGDPAAPNCIVCHDHHAIVPSDDPSSPSLEACELFHGLLLEEE